MESKQEIASITLATELCASVGHVISAFCKKCLDNTIFFGSFVIFFCGVPLDASK